MLFFGEATQKNLTVSMVMKKFSWKIISMSLWYFQYMIIIYYYGWIYVWIVVFRSLDVPGDELKTSKFHRRLNADDEAACPGDWLPNRTRGSNCWCWKWVYPKLTTSIGQWIKQWILGYPIFSQAHVMCCTYFPRSVNWFGIRFEWAFRKSSALGSICWRSINTLSSGLPSCSF